MEAIELILMIGMPTATSILMIYFINRSRCSLEQAEQLSGCPQHDLRELIQVGMLDYRRKYLVVGPHSLDVSEIEPARVGYQEVRRIQAETDAEIRRMAEKAAAEIQESNRQYQEQIRVMQEEREYMRRAYEAIRESLLAGKALLPAEVTEAFTVLGLAHDASFEEVQQRYRQLAKQYHPDAGGNAEQFIRVNTAYQTIRNWLESKGHRNA